MIRGYYFITDDDLTKHSTQHDVKAAVSAGVSAIQYRNKNEDNASFFRKALALKKLCGKSIFIINDRIDIALAVNADGIHLGQGELPCRTARNILGGEKVIGITVHTKGQALRAEADGADYVGVSPIFPTSTKHDAGHAKGLSLIRTIKKYARIPVVAIGGIDLSNAPAVIAAGADAVCAISAVVTKKKVKKEILKFNKLFK